MGLLFAKFIIYIYVFSCFCQEYNFKSVIIPKNLCLGTYRKNQLANYEGYYASIVYCYFAALGLDVCAEDTTNHGRIDMTVKLGKDIYIFEFKVVELLAEGRALQQIKDKGYADKYRTQGARIHMIGVEFSCKKRNVVRFEVESDKI